MQNRESKQFVIGTLILAALFFASMLYVRARVRQSPGMSSAQRAVQGRLKGEIEAALKQYYEICKQYPNTDPGLEVLVRREKDADCPQLKEPLMKKVPGDVWGNPFFYHRTAEGYTLESFGKSEGPTGPIFDRVD